jgi:hypothetical protein
VRPNFALSKAQLQLARHVNRAILRALTEGFCIQSIPLFQYAADARVPQNTPITKERSVALQQMEAHPDPKAMLNRVTSGRTRLSGTTSF